MGRVNKEVSWRGRSQDTDRVGMNILGASGFYLLMSSLSLSWLDDIQLALALSGKIM